MRYSLILLSGGKGVRLGKEVPKQYLSIMGKPMLVYVLEQIDQVEELEQIIIVCDRIYSGIINNYRKQYGLTKQYCFVNGGRTRQESVYNGLINCRNENIVIHEAARPFVRKEDFKKLIDCTYDNVSFVYDVPYTVLKKKGDFISETLNREELVNIQLPQKFLKKDLLECHYKAINENKNFTEDASMINYYLNKEVFCLKGKNYNIKITEYIDLLFAEMLCKEKILEG